MNLKRLPLVALVLLTLSCSFLGGAPAAPTATPVPTIAPSETLAPTQTVTPSRTVTPEPTATETPVPSPTEAVAPPAYIPPECKSVPLATIPPATTVAEPTPILTANPPLTTKQQLQVFDELAAIITEVYLYPDFNGLDWPSVVARYRAAVQAGLETEVFYTTMGEFIFELGDEHSHFLSPAEVAVSEANLSGIHNYFGIGVYGRPLPEKGRVTILAVFPDSPAARSGLQPHDSLLAVDGLPIVEDGIAHPQRVRGPECSAVVLTVQSPGEAPRLLTLIRARVTGSLPIDARLVPTRDGSRIAYIFLPTFFDETIPDQVLQALQDFGPLDGLILDNRMNSGGSYRVVEPLLSYFTEGALGVFVSRTDTRPLEIRAHPIHNSQSVPLVVLVGEHSVSFGEIFSGVLQDTGRAKIVGQTTAGNVETLVGYTFDDGSQAWIAQQRFDPIQSHADWEKDGIQPDVEAYADWDTYTFETDPSVAAAVALLGHE